MASSLDLNSFSHLGTFTVAHDTRLVSGACNPEKDLVLLIHQAEPRDTLSLWKLQGSKRWEVDVASNFAHNGAMRHIAWSPDGDKFAIGHAVKRVTVHSVLDGCEEYRYDDSTSSGEGPKSTWKIAAVSWLKVPWKYFWNQEISKAPPPQLYPRDYDVPGSALYLFKQLPKLDSKNPLIEISAPTELSANRAPRLVQPSQIDDWPSLPSNPLAASISTTISQSTDQPFVNDPNERWNVIQSNTCLFAGDNHGALYPFIHGTYRTGAIETKFSHLMSIVTGTSSFYFSRLSVQPIGSSLSVSGPSLSVLALTGRIFTPQSDQKSLSSSNYKIRDILRISTAAKDLAMYAWRNCDEARLGWMGGPGREGAKEWNAKWIKVLQIRNQGKAVDVKADLTSLLLTGLPLSAALPEHLEHGNQTTERNFKKWHAVVGETLVAIKHASELAILSLQRLIALLWDLYGLAEIRSISQDFLLDQRVIKGCIDTAQHAIGILVSMTDVARQEGRGFQHFMVWLRGLIPNLPPADPPLKPYDTVLVNDYISRGFSPSQLDAFFQSSVTEEPASDVGDEPERPQSLEDVASIALRALSNLQEGGPSDKLSGQVKSSKNEVDIVSTISTLLTQCTAMFAQISNSIVDPTETNKDGEQVARSIESGLHIDTQTSWKEVILPHGVKHSTSREAYLQVPRLQEELLREKLVVIENGVNHFIMLRLPEQDGRRQQICLVRVTHTQNPPRTEDISCTIFDLVFMADDDPENDKPVAGRLLDAQFYDDTQLVLVLQTTEETPRRSLSLLDFAGLQYHQIPITATFIDIAADIIPKFINGDLSSGPMPLTRSRIIPSSKGGEAVSLAVNSKRKVAVLLDHDSWTVYSYDISADDEDEEEAEESQEVEQDVEEDSMTM